MKKIALLLFSASICSGAFAQFSIKKALVEEHTGAWCQYCPDGAVILDQVLNANQNAIGVSVHNGDAMVITEGDELGAFYVSGYPNATIDRSGAGLSRNLWMSNTNAATTGAGYVTVAFDSVIYNSTTRVVNAYIKATFTGPQSGDMRFNLIVTEDNVTGSGSGYNQVNYFNTIAGHTYYGSGNPIVGFNHRHVARAYLGGAWGDAGIIPNSVNLGSVATTSYSYTLPAGYDENEIHLVALVSRYDGAAQTDRKVLNSEEVQLIEPVSITPMVDGSFIYVSPNPMSDRLSITFDLNATSNLKVEILNMLGQHVTTIAEGIMNDGMHSLYWNGADDKGSPVSNGLYFVNLVTDAGQVLTKRVNVQH